MKIIDIQYDNNDVKGGCSTCDYGSRYVRDMTITYEDKSVLKVLVNARFEQDGLSESDWMLILVNASTREDIIEEIKKIADKASRTWGEISITVLINEEEVYKYEKGDE